MSEEINNREYRQKVIKELISELHAGKSVEEVKCKFEAAFKGVSAEEISQAEQTLIADGLPISEVQRLCDVHAAVFRGSIEEIHQSDKDLQTPGHPAHTLKEENQAMKRLVYEISADIASDDRESMLKNLGKLSEIERHYLKKENLFFPYMEQYGITAPPKVMWGVDDEIRVQLKEVKKELELKNPSEIKDKIEALLNKIMEMIFKEENIMLPMLIENLTQDEWKKIAEESVELGYCLIDKVPVWIPPAQKDSQSVEQEKKNSDLVFPTGMLSLEELNLMLDTLPVDITFIGKEETVKYFSQSKERIFPRTKAIIGRKVSNCHPPASVHIVEQLVNDLKSGNRDHEDFWINMGDKLVLIRYFAVRDKNGEYIGTMEVTQNIKPLQEIKGEKRLVTDTK